MIADLSTRFWAKVQIDTEDGCWIWTGANDGYGGYGSFSVAGERRKAHRVAYELMVGPIPEGFELDHVCHTSDLTCPGGRACAHRACVNPAHLEPVTHQENALRRRARITHCPQGHDFDRHGLLQARNDRPGAQRVCRECHRLGSQRRRAAR